MPQRLIALLQNYENLSGADRQALEAIVGQRKTHPAGVELFDEGVTSTDCRLLTEGLAFRHKTLPDGRRQITCFHIPGDILDLQRLFVGLDYAATTLMTCEVAMIPRAALEAVMNAHPRIARALWAHNLAEGAVFRAWMVGMGRRSAYARIAHLLCEVVVRLRSVGVMSGDRCHFPVTQTHLADSLGLSVVHTNRVLQTLRADRLVEVRGRELIVLNWAGLTAAGEFDPAYLHLGDRAA